ncbi:MAG: hypothetical protein ACNA7W_08990 [Pseudomonadales bacterium]
MSSADTRGVGRRRAPLLAVMACLGLLAGCSSNPPRSPDDVCAIFDERPRWYRHAQAVEREWGLPVHITMAFVERESSYVARARPSRNRLLGIVPWRRPSSAYGYAQATNAAWEDYRNATGRMARRRDFADAVDFIGWYNHRSARALGIGKTDAYHLYLAYHEGPSGYRSGNWRRSSQVQGYARKVQDRAARYQSQLARCEGDLGRGFWRRLLRL